MKRRKALGLAAIVCVLAITVVGSLAYFTDRDSVTNTFMMSTYDPDNPSIPTEPEDVFSVKIYETEDGIQTTEGRTYTEVRPGDTLDKDPTIENTGAYSQWVRVQVTITNAASWQAACEKYDIMDLMSIFGGYDENKWIRYSEPEDDKEANIITYEFYLNKELKPGETETLFTSVTIPAKLTEEDMETLSVFEIKITADAIQSEGTGENAQEAFDSYWE